VDNKLRREEAQEGGTSVDSGDRRERGKKATNQGKKKKGETASGFQHERGGGKCLCLIAGEGREDPRHTRKKQTEAGGKPLEGEKGNGYYSSLTRSRKEHVLILLFCWGGGKKRGRG